MDKQFNFMNAFLMLSDMDNGQTLEQKAKTKERIVFATMKANIPQCHPPKGWNELPAAERLKRLERIQKDVI